jgi:uncharacterized protein (TIGR02117 family)
MNRSLGPKSNQAMRPLLAASLILPMLIGAGCLGPQKSLYPPAAGQVPRLIYVVSHGWHTGLIIRREDIRKEFWPAAGDFGPAKYVEVGWGDDGFYRAEKITVAITLDALFWPSASVLHIVAVNDPVSEFPGSRLAAVELSPQGFDRLCEFIHQTHAYSSNGNPMRLGPGLYGESQFYRARGKYYFPKTCNHWTAKALRRAGCPITPIYSITAGNVLFQSRRFAQ